MFIYALGLSDGFKTAYCKPMLRQNEFKKCSVIDYISMAGLFFFFLSDIVILRLYIDFVENSKLPILKIRSNKSALNLWLHYTADDIMLRKKCTVRNFQAEWRRCEWRDVSMIYVVRLRILLLKCDMGVPRSVLYNLVYVLIE